MGKEGHCLIFPFTDVRLGYRLKSKTIISVLQSELGYKYLDLHAGIVCRQLTISEGWGYKYEVSHQPIGGILKHVDNVKKWK